jgi:polyisoprenoid-binding protein YceI
MKFATHNAAAPLLFLLALVFSNAGAKEPQAFDVPAGTYALDKTHGSIVWRVRHMGLSNYTARFKRFDASIQFDPQNVARSSVRASVDIASIETDFIPADGRDFNAELQSEPFFNAAKFPQATFVSTRVTRTGPQTMTVDGTLTLLGISKPLTLKATLNGSLKSHPFAKVPAIGFTATAAVPRLAFGLNPPPIQQGVGEVAEIVINAEFIQQP